MQPGVRICNTYSPCCTSWRSPPGTKITWCVDDTCFDALWLKYPLSAFCRVPFTDPSKSNAHIGFARILNGHHDLIGYFIINEFDTFPGKFSIRAIGHRGIEIPEFLIYRTIGNVKCTLGKHRDLIERSIRLNTSDLLLPGAMPAILLISLVWLESSNVVSNFSIRLISFMAMSIYRLAWSSLSRTTLISNWFPISPDIPLIDLPVNRWDQGSHHKDLMFFNDSMKAATLPWAVFLIYIRSFLLG